MIDVFFKKNHTSAFQQYPEYGVTKIWQILISFATFLDLHTTFGILTYPQWIYKFVHQSLGVLSIVDIRVTSLEQLTVVEFSGD